MQLFLFSFMLSMQVSIFVGQQAVSLYIEPFGYNSTAFVHQPL